MFVYAAELEAPATTVFMVWLRTSVYHIERFFKKAWISGKNQLFPAFIKTGNETALICIFIVVQNVIHQCFGRLTDTEFFCNRPSVHEVFCFQKQAVISWTVCRFRKAYFSVGREVFCNVLIH
jgi:hypothetical protein